jgi:hypothetical protein
MEYLLEEYLFSDEDIRLNADTLLWPRNIGPIFDTNDEVISSYSKLKKKNDCFYLANTTNSKQK